MDEDRVWWKTFFDQDYLDIYLGTFSPERTTKEVDFTIKVVDLKPTDVILDLACGHGRHAIELAKRGFKVTGLDYSDLFLQKARADAQENGVNVEFIRGDMRQLPFTDKFDVVLMMFTAFGYFDNEDNHKTINNVKGVLRSRGRFLLDCVNSDAVLSRYKSDGTLQSDNKTYTRQGIVQMSKVDIKEEAEFNTETLIEHVHRRWNLNGEDHSDDYYLQHYTLEELKKMLSESGFQFKQVWGDYNGNPINQTNYRAIILAQKN